MSIMGECQNCKDLNMKVEIRSPRELKKVLEAIKEHVGTGILTVLPEESPWSKPFAQVNISGPWDNIVNYVFRCNSCAKKSRLSAETYHGSGGQWKPI
jgi:hypothetical protein